MPLLTISGSGAMKRVERFLDDTDHHIEGDATVQLGVNAACTQSIQVTDAFEWWCAAGGWVTNLWTPGPTFYSFGPAMAAGSYATNWQIDQYDPIEHLVIMARVTDPAGVQPAEWAVG